jgi:hypothetical protein
LEREFSSRAKPVLAFGCDGTRFFIIRGKYARPRCVRGVRCRRRICAAGTMRDTGGSTWPSYAKKRSSGWSTQGRLKGCSGASCWMLSEKPVKT